MSLDGLAGIANQWADFPPGAYPRRANREEPQGVVRPSAKPMTGERFPVDTGWVLAGPRTLTLVSRRAPFQRALSFGRMITDSVAYHGR